MGYIRSRNLRPDDFQSVSDLAKLPYLTRDIILDQGARTCAPTTTLTGFVGSAQWGNDRRTRSGLQLISVLAPEVAGYCAGSSG